MMRLAPTRYACRAVFPATFASVLLYGFIQGELGLRLLFIVQVVVACACLFAEMHEREDEIDGIEEWLGGDR